MQGRTSAFAFVYVSGILSNIFKSPQNRLQTEMLPPLDSHAQKVFIDFFAQHQSERLFDTRTVY